MYSTPQSIPRRQHGELSRTTAFVLLAVIATAGLHLLLWEVSANPLRLARLDALLLLFFAALFCYRIRRHNGFVGLGLSFLLLAFGEILLFQGEGLYADVGEQSRALALACQATAVPGLLYALWQFAHPAAAGAAPTLQEQSTHMLDTMADGFYACDRNGVLRHANPAFAAFLQIEPARLIGQTPESLLPATEADLLRQAHSRCLQGDQVLLELNLPRRDRPLSLSLQLTPLRDTRDRVIGLSAIARDISLRRRIESALQRNESLLRATFNATADCLLATDHKGLVTHANQQARQLWNLPDPHGAEAGRHPFRNSIPRLIENPGQFAARAESLLRTFDEAEGALHFLDGRYIEWFSAPLVIEDRLTGRVFGFRDRTERVRAEEERSRLQEQVQQAQKLESLGLLAGGIAHDFNNLLMGIMGNAELALMDLPRNASSRGFLIEIDTASRRASELCRQMLAYSGRGSFIVEPFSLNLTIRELLDQLRESLPGTRAVTLELEEDLPLIEGDLGQIRQLLTNLIHNATEAIAPPPEGRIWLRTRCGRDDGRSVELEVADNGNGMSENDLEKIFDPFFSTKFTGRGLGLAAVQGIVRGHHARLEVQSSPGQGALFRIVFPVANHPQPPRREPEHATAWQEAPPT